MDEERERCLVRNYLQKKERGKTTEYKVESENLAVPEIHTHNIHSEEASEDERNNEPITYENVAIPEIHIKKRKK